MQVTASSSSRLRRVGHYPGSTRLARIRELVNNPETKRRRLKLLTSIHDCFMLGARPAGYEGFFRSYSQGQGTLTVLGDENCRNFEDGVDALLRTDQKLQSSLSYKAFEEGVVALMRRTVPRGSAPTISECEEMWSQFETMPVEEYQVIRPVHGVSLGATPKVLTLGSFRFFDVSLHANEVITNERVGLPSWFRKDHSGICVECRVMAREVDKALELADHLYRQLEMILTAMIGLRYESYRVRILSVPLGSVLRHAMFTNRAVLSGAERLDPTQVLHLDNPAFTSPGTALASLLSIPGAEGTSLEHRIMRAVEWIGESLLDGSTAGAFIKSATALEVLLREDQEGPITPSIMAQLAECTAYILAQSSEQGVRTEREIKRLYGLRSKIVHSGADTVDVRDYHQFAHIALSLIWQILGDPRYRNMKSVKELHAFLKQQKYSVCKPS